MISPRAALSAIGLLVLVSGCSGSGSSGGGSKTPPDSALVESEFRYAYSQFIAGRRSNGELSYVEVSEIDHEKGAPVAKAVIRYAAPVNGNSVSKAGTFLFRKSDSGWQIYDRDLANPNSSTAYQFAN